MPTTRLSKEPAASHIVLVDNFISRDECNFILEELVFVLWRPSLTYMLQEVGTRRDVLSPLRVSETAQQEWFSDDLKVFLKVIERRLQNIVNMKLAHLESWQATSYPNKGKFYYHLDAGYWDTHYAGDRILTFLLYLTTPQKCGGTHFRALSGAIQQEFGCARANVPIELAFAKSKTRLRIPAERTVGALWVHIRRLLESFTPEECASHSEHIGEML